VETYLPNNSYLKIQKIGFYNLPITALSKWRRRRGLSILCIIAKCFVKSAS